MNIQISKFIIDNIDDIIPDLDIEPCFMMPRFKSDKPNERRSVKSTGYKVGKYPRINGMLFDVSINPENIMLGRFKEYAHPSGLELKKMERKAFSNTRLVEIMGEKIPKIRTRIKIPEENAIVICNDGVVARSEDGVISFYFDRVRALVFKGTVYYRYHKHDEGNQGRKTLLRSRQKEKISYWLKFQQIEESDIVAEITI